LSSTDSFPIAASAGLTYGLEETKLTGALIQLAESGKRYERQKRADQRTWRAGYYLTSDQLEQVRAFYDQFHGKDEYFIWTRPAWANNAGPLTDRKFPVHWAGPAPQVLFAGHEFLQVQIELAEAIGRAMETADYPVFTSGFETFFIEESHAVRAAAVTGTWSTETNSNNHGPASNNGKTNANTNTTDKFRYTYFGYGFRYWARKASNLGILKVLLDDVDLGNVDLYNASGVAAAALLTKTDVALGLHRVDIKATNTKNASSSGNTIVSDAVEVMP